MQIKAGDSVIVCGTLPRDSEFKYVGDKQTPLCKFGLKVGERDTGGDRPEAIWRNCTCWRDVAHAASEFVKGDAVFAIGKLQTHTYTGRDGDEKSSTELVCEFVSRMEISSGSNSAERQGSAAPLPDMEELPDDGELPF